jgi:hypothetical protein
MEFVWDEEKAAAHVTKHGVTFEEATTAFNDPLYVDFYDPDHSDVEERYLLIGRSAANRLILVSYTERDGKNRIISAREATRYERRDYEEGTE